mmetsp:Transcript_71202/g.230499  ORF Transcript_71202/g.230499 Transcript_71202/m.230499 type:complete len:212 (-) Transcript_71202:89-724(-)
MGKYAKKPQKQKKAVAGRSSTLQNLNKKKAKNKKKNKAKKKVLKKIVQQTAEEQAPAQAPSGAADAPGDQTMDTSGGSGAASPACTKVVAFLSRARTESKAVEAVKKTLRTRPAPDVLGAALNHMSGRGLASCVRLLIESSAPLNQCDPSQPVGRSTPLQLAASRGHVNVCRLLVEVGADRAGAMEACQDLAKLGAVFLDERKAIQAVLSS